MAAASAGVAFPMIMLFLRCSISSLPPSQVSRKFGRMQRHLYTKLRLGRSRWYGYVLHLKYPFNHSTCTNETNTRIDQVSPALLRNNKSVPVLFCVLCKSHLALSRLCFECGEFFYFAPYFFNSFAIESSF